MLKGVMAYEFSQYLFKVNKKGPGTSLNSFWNNYRALWKTLGDELFPSDFELEILDKCFFFENPLRVRDQTQ